MTLKETIKKYKLSADDFVIVHNKDSKWIIAGLRDDVRLVDYLDYNVLTEELQKNHWLLVQIDYDKNMQIAYYRMKEEMREAAVVSGKASGKKRK